MNSLKTSIKCPSSEFYPAMANSGMSSDSGYGCVACLLTWDVCFALQVVKSQHVRAQGKLVLRDYENSNWEYVRVNNAFGNSTSMGATLLGMSGQAPIQDNGGLQVICFIQLAHCLS